MPAVTAVSNFVKGGQPFVTGDCAGDVVVNDYYIDLTAAQLVTGNMFDLGILPAGHVISNAILISDDIDTNATPAVTLDVGILSGTPGDATSDRTMDDVIFAASTVGQSGTAASASAKSAFIIKPTNDHRSIGLKVKQQPATAAAGRVRLRAFMHPAAYPQQF